MASQSRVTRVLNLSLGNVLSSPIELHTNYKQLALESDQVINITLRLSNTAEHLHMENRLAEVHSFEAKQDFNYNPRLSAETASLEIIYDDYDAGNEENPDFIHIFNQHLNDFLHQTLSGICGFLQRRRVIIHGVQALPSSTGIVWIGLMIMSGEFIDSVGHGQIALPYENLPSAIQMAATCFLESDSDSRNQITMLLRRYNDVLNLPYTYERFDGFWRIIECMPDLENITQNQEAEIKAAFVALNINKSRNLRAFLATLLQNDVPFTIAQIRAAFEYRNESTHNYLSKSIIDHPDLPDCFHFVEQCVDRLMFKQLNVDPSLLIPARHNIILNRVM